MKKIVFFLMVFTSTLLFPEKISFMLFEAMDREELRFFEEVMNELKGDGKALKVSLKRKQLTVTGEKAALRKIVLSYPYAVHEYELLERKVAPIVHLDPSIMQRKEVEEFVWKIKDETGKKWKYFHGTKVYTVYDVPPFNPKNVFDELGHFRKEVVDYFYSLPASKEEREKTYKLIDKMGTLPWYRLVFHINELEKIGEDVDHVHPLRFAAVIFENPHLKHCMKEIRSYGLKWSRFTAGFSGKMDKNFAQRNLLPYLPGFCEVTGADYGTCLTLLEERRWVDFLNYLIDK